MSLDLDQLEASILRKFHNEAVEQRNAHGGTVEDWLKRVGTWLAGVSFDEWFALTERVRRLEAVTAAARPALAFYADPRNWTEGGDVFDTRSGFGDGVIEVEYDHGQRARAALAVVDAPEPEGDKT